MVHLIGYYKGTHTSCAGHLTTLQLLPPSQLHLQEICIHSRGCVAQFERHVLAGKAGGVLLTTYGMCLHNADMLAKPATPTSSLFRAAGGVEEPGDFKWDMVILDEGHKVCMRACASALFGEIEGKRRMLL